MKHIPLLLFSLSLIAALALPTAPVRAGECFEQPPITLNGSATVKSGVFVRSVACMEGSEVVSTLSAGEIVATTRYDHGWYEIKRTDGTSGWVWEDFLTINFTPVVIEEQKEVEKKEEVHTEAEVEKTHTETVKTSDASLLSRTRGYIVLQVEDHGEAWYVHPTENVRYYMKDGPTAYEMMRAFGLGITDSDLAKLQAGDASLKSQLKGRIVLQVEQHGEAYYVHPKDGSVHYMKDGEAAYSIMRSLSLGITNADLAKLASKEFESVPYKENEQRQEETPSEDETTASTVSTVATENFGDIRVSANQQGLVPTGIDLVEANEYWLKRINSLREAKGLRELVLDQRWVDTATEYAGYMYAAKAFAHERADGSTMHEWIGKKNLEFTDRFSVPDGWRSNYFTENISWGYANNSMEGMEAVLEEALGYYLSEASSNGPHYRTIYHEDWNTVGLGAYFEPLGGDNYKVYLTFHYGSLKMP